MPTIVSGKKHGYKLTDGLHGSLYYDGFNDYIYQVCTSIKLPGAAKETNHWPAPLQADGATCSFSLSRLQLSSVPQSNKKAMTDLTTILLFSWGAYFKHLMGLKSAIWILLSNFREKAMICWPSKDKLRASYTFSYPYNNLTSIKYLLKENNWIRIKAWYICIISASAQTQGFIL